MRLLVSLALPFVLAACSAASAPPAAAPPADRGAEPASPAARANPEGSAPAAPSDVSPATATQEVPVPELATLANGCYWCTEAVFQRLPGVLKVRSGFIGGTVPNPTYEQACSGETGHAEAVEITFDPKKISYETLLDWFWSMHDPSTLNRQGADVGTQYRSAIFWHSEAQRAAAEKSKKEAQASFEDPIVTEITKASAFYEADAYHQNYYNSNKAQGYCRAVIAPKLKKLGLDDKK